MPIPAGLADDMFNVIAGDAFRNSKLSVTTEMALLERLWALDEYRGKPLAAAARSVTWRLVFRAPDRTLREEEADKALARAATTVEDRHGVRRREA